ncbi:MAG: DUF3500 domain-containing protein [Gammaproteobacteria bacterium]|nr:DUF3500 domain-containing protein [Gammaproteobacteria bacterium]
MTLQLRVSLAAACLAATACGVPESDSGMPESAIVPLPAFASLDVSPGGKATYDAAVAFRTTLSESQATKLILPIDSPLRRNWSNLPAGVTDFERNGLRLGDLQPDQLVALFTFLAAGLGQHGYDTVADVVTAEALLADSFLAGGFGWSATNYWLAFFGEPRADDAWGWQFGGHHLAINVSLDRGRVVSMSPSFIGIEPANYEFQGRHHAPFADELADGRTLMWALPGSLRDQALVGSRPREVRAGPGKDGVVPVPEGGIVADWPDDARGMLLDIVSHWLRLQPEENALPRLAAVEASLDDTRFAWHGAIEGEGDVYYRIQGPSLIIEFWSEDGVGDDGGHYHSIYRDPTNEYGGTL